MYRDYDTEIANHISADRSIAAGEAFNRNIAIEDQYNDAMVASGTYIDLDTWLRDNGLYDTYYENVRIQELAK